MRRFGRLAIAGKRIVRDLGAVQIEDRQILQAAKVFYVRDGRIVEPEHGQLRESAQFLQPGVRDRGTAKIEREQILKIPDFREAGIRNHAIVELEIREVCRVTDFAQSRVRDLGFPKAE